MAYRWVEHTAELELEIETATEQAVFRDALEAFAELVADGAGAGTDGREVHVRGGDRALLLVAWLEELVFLAETQGFVAEQATELELRHDSLQATLRGCAGEPRHLVKAVTLHRLRFDRDGAGWQARVVLDV